MIALERHIPKWKWPECQDDTLVWHVCADWCGSTGQKNIRRLVLESDTSGSIRDSFSNCLGQTWKVNFRPYRTHLWLEGTISSNGNDKNNWVIAIIDETIICQVSEAAGSHGFAQGKKPENWSSKKSENWVKYIYI
jgi:hypothetical protein